MAKAQAVIEGAIKDSSNPPEGFLGDFLVAITYSIITDTVATTLPK
jgi:hypothetical protein